MIKCGRKEIAMQMRTPDKKISDMLFICSEDIAEFVRRRRIDAVVNAANPTLMGSDQGVDKSIHDAVSRGYPAGKKFKDTIREQIDGNLEKSEKTFRCKRGEVRVTSGESLCRYVIHAVGTEYDGKKNGKLSLCSSSCIITLEKCYVEIVKALREHPDIRSVAIPIIGAGNYRFPPKLAIRIAVSAVGNALIDWKIKDPELFNMAALEEIYFCIYSTEETERCQNTYYAGKILEKYKQCFKNEKKVVYQNSLVAHLCYMTEIVKYDRNRGYFAVAKMFRLFMMAVRSLFLPITVLKDLFGQYDWQRRRMIVELITVLKIIWPCFILLYPGIWGCTAGQRNVMGILTIYFMADTITYLLILILLADIQKPSANIIRSLILLFLNYLEVSLDSAAICYLYNEGKVMVADAVGFGLLDKEINGVFLSANIYLGYVNAAVKFFFTTLAFGYFANHLRQRKFRS